MRPVLRYHGGKFRIAPWIIERMPEHRIYVEPFGGAGSVLMRKPPSFGEILNDLDGDVVNVFQVLRDPAAAERLADLCRLTPFSRDEFRLSYEPTDDPVEQARRTVFRSFAAFGSSSRSNRRTGFRANAFRERHPEPMAWARWPEHIRRYVDRLRGVVIESRPGLEVIAQQDRPDALFYCDPPYPLSTRTSIRCDGDIGRAYSHEMTDEDHRELAGVLHAIKGMAMISGYRCELYDEEYSSWERHDVPTQADGGVHRVDSLWLNAAAVAARRGLFT